MRRYTGEDLQRVVAEFSSLEVAEDFAKALNGNVGQYLFQVEGNRESYKVTSVSAVSASDKQLISKLDLAFRAGLSSRTKIHVKLYHKLV